MGNESDHFEEIRLNEGTTGGEVERFLVYHKNYLLSIAYKDLIICFLQDRSIQLVTAEDQLFTSARTMNEMEEKLPKQDFFRINRSCIISYKSIERMEPFFGHRIIIFTTSKLVPKVLVSRSRVQEFKRWLGE